VQSYVRPFDAGMWPPALCCSDRSSACTGLLRRPVGYREGQYRSARPRQAPGYLPGAWSSQEPAFSGFQGKKVGHKPAGPLAPTHQGTARNCIISRRCCSSGTRCAMRVPRTVADGLARKLSRVSGLQVIPELTLRFRGHISFPRQSSQRRVDHKSGSEGILLQRPAFRQIQLPQNAVSEFQINDQRKNFTGGAADLVPFLSIT
jgi:hypothetical protein